MNKENVKYLLNRASSLIDAMTLVYETESKDSSEYSKMSAFSSHKTFAIQLNALAIDVRKEFSDANFMVYDISKMKNQFNSVYMYRRDIFDGTFIEVGKIKAFLESKLGQEQGEINNIINLITAKLRNIIRTTPTKELEVQDKIEDLLIGKGLARGTDFDRETGRVKTGVKESVPDFMFESLDFCIEVKLVKAKTDLKKITEQINSDTTAYKTKYKKIFYVVYDTRGLIQNTDAFKYNIADKNVYLEVVKH